MTFTFKEYNETGLLIWHSMNEEPINKDTKIWFIFGKTSNSRIRVDTWNNHVKRKYAKDSDAYAWAYPILPKF